ncbi:MAG TPA: histidine kinase dimerization/phospho-acceptor domain-containing protein [Actinomycetota bacterium]
MAQRETARRLAALDEQKNTLLTAVSHELRTPLTAIRGASLTWNRPAVDSRRRPSPVGARPALGKTLLGLQRSMHHQQLAHQVIQGLAGGPPARITRRLVRFGVHRFGRAMTRA